MNRSLPVRVYYLCSGALGIPVLDALRRDQRVDLAGVGTQPDRISGRKRVLTSTPLGAHADAVGVAADRIPSVNAPDFLQCIAALTIDLLLVASFGQVLRKALLGLPRVACLNVHASLLPRYRGASPVQAAIMAGDTETGISFMQMDPGLDTGPVYETHTTPIADTDTAGSLEERLGCLAAEHIGDCIWRVAREGLTPVEQDTDAATYAAKMTKADGQVDWSLPAKGIERRMRALQPWPRAFSWINTNRGPLRIQITAAHVTSPSVPAGTEPGQVIQADRHAWIIACGEEGLCLERVIPEGRREMEAAEFLRGHPLVLPTRMGRPNPSGG